MRTSRGGGDGFFDLMGLSEERIAGVIGAVGWTMSYLRGFYIANARPREVWRAILTFPSRGLRGRAALDPSQGAQGRERS